MEEENDIDSKIKHELECLNTTSLKINDLENEINEKRSQYRTALASSTQRLNAIAQKLGDCIGKARPYYDAKRIAKQAHNEAQQAAIHFERAASMHMAAREMVTVAEKGMVNDSQDTAWAEMLNHAIARVNEAEADRFRSEAEHQKRADAFKNAEEKVKKLQKNLKSSIKKSQPYFEMKKHTQLTLETITSSVNQVEEELKKLKQLYSVTLQNLEEISDSIHASRSLSCLAKKEGSLVLGQRQDGVGAEAPFNDQEIIADLSLKLEQSSSQLSILNDLRESDSIDQLSSVNELSSVDVISFSSSVSQCSSIGSSSTSVNNGKEGYESSQEKTGSDLTVSIHNTASNDTADTLLSQSSPLKQSSASWNASSDKGASSSAISPQITQSSVGTIKYSHNDNNSIPLASTAAGTKISTPGIANSRAKEKELVLSVAGLGAVSSNQ